MKMALIGVGLIGGSFARAAKRAGKFDRIIGFDVQSEALRRALELGVIDDIALSAAHAVANADLVMIATPIGSIRDVLSEIAAHLSDTAIITDVASAKASVIETASEQLGVAFSRFVPGHPIAGSEHSGVERSDAMLFRGNTCVTTPVVQTGSDALEGIESLWRDVGCVVKRMTPQEHDRVFAAVSHLPHLIAFALVANIASQSDADRKFEMAGPGFRDFTRIARSSASLWSDICVSNRAAIGDQLRGNRRLLEELQRALDEGDAETLRRVFQQAGVALDRRVNAE
ncbi:MAG: prephenate dehydrogenase/arogenate dehydrogenase family protein [Pseudomonadota bacterium]|nr:prephenate dehydrogenase/arogenate dehydrogenase family protein [Pseudomonadota bacterium]